VINVITCATGESKRDHDADQAERDALVALRKLAG
jgi:hypothetical protein